MSVKLMNECSYCRMIGKSEKEYNTHNIRNAAGKAICLEFQKLKCAECDATGEDAHESYFCPDEIERRCYMNDLEKTARNLQSFLDGRKARNLRPSQQLSRQFNEPPRIQPSRQQSRQFSEPLPSQQVSFQQTRESKRDFSRSLRKFYDKQN